MSASNSSLAPQASAPSRATQIGLLFAIITGLTVPMYAFIAWQLQAWQLWAVAGTNFILMVGGLVAWQLARRGRVVGALRLLIGVLILGALLSVTFVGGIGILGAILVVMLGLFIATQGLPRHQLNRAITILIGAAFGVMLVSYLTEPLQFQAPGLDIFITIASLVIIIVFGGFILRQFNTYPLPVKLLIAFVGTVVTALALQGFLSNLVIRQALEERAGANLKALSASKSQELLGLLQIRLSSMEAFSLSKFLQDPLIVLSEQPRPEDETIMRLERTWKGALSDSAPIVLRIVNNELAEELRIYQKNFSGNSEMFITDRWGITMAATNRITDLYQADEEWWQKAVSDGVYIGEPEYDASANVVSVNLAIPIRPNNRVNFVGVLRTTLDLQTFEQVFSAGLPGATGDLELFLPSGQHYGITAQGQLQERGEPFATEQVARWFDAAKIYQQTVEPATGENRLLSASPLVPLDRAETKLERIVANLGWHLVTTQAQSEAMSGIDTVTDVSLAVVLAAMLVAALFATFVAQIFSSPITRLTQTAAKITGGDINAQAPVEADDEVGALATAFNVMTAQIRETLEGLEARVAERTRAIATSAEVSRRLSTVLDRQKLVSEVVEQVRAAFNYYHVHIYFWDDTREHLVMAGGSGETGQIMLARGHKIPAGRGLVGRAADTNDPVLVTNTAENPNWLPNPLLPNTKAELAVPIALGDRVLGVLDVQHDVVNGLNEEDVEVLQSLANQVAVAAQNARTFAQAQRQADVEALVNTIGQKIQSATTVESAMQIAVREVGRALGGTKAVVRLKAQTAPETAQVN